MAKIDYPESLTELIQHLKKLPAIGARSAERIALWLLMDAKANPAALAEAMVESQAKVSFCPVCGFFQEEGNCQICSDVKRLESKQICIVEKAPDVLSFERSGVFKGSYHCLGGKLSPLDGVFPEDLKIEALKKRLAELDEVELILALSSDVEGEATANFLIDELSAFSCSISQIAQGLPAGGGIDFVDDLTLSKALEGRKQV